MTPKFTTPQVDVINVETIDENDFFAKIIVYDDPIFPIQLAIFAFMRALGFSKPKAEFFAETITKNGKAIVYESNINDCIRKTDALRNLGIDAQVLV